VLACVKRALVLRFPFQPATPGTGETDLEAGAETGASDSGEVGLEGCGVWTMGGGGAVITGGAEGDGVGC